ncbi:uncharacterized protein LOC134496021 [Candoia aspera]|uniref:uncharacterized protein LOC134496021 n=1 Tax=Candoia aspera TaxID=51853 RepID=UPI002FD7D16A
MGGCVFAGFYFILQLLLRAPLLLLCPPLPVTHSLAIHGLCWGTDPPPEILPFRVHCCQGRWGPSTPIKLRPEAQGGQTQSSRPLSPSWTKAVYLLVSPRNMLPAMKPRPPLLLLLLLLCLLLPASQTPVRSPQLLLEILRQDLALLLSGDEAGPRLLPLGSAPPPLSRQPSPRLPTLHPGHPWHYVLHDWAKTQRRLRGRPKKTAPLGCFGIKLDRIGTFSGLGC